jgi:hypothetical protein
MRAPTHRVGELHTLASRTDPVLRALRFPVLLATSTLLLGCPTSYLKETEFSTQADAGSVTVSVQSVAPFDEYIDSLQPHFDLSSADALKKALPESRIREVTELRAIAARLQVALSRLTIPASGAAARVPGNTSTLAANPEADLPTATPLALPSPPGLQQDPTYQYEDATYLYQKVALLNTYVRDAAVTKDEVPYYVRLLVTSLPKARVSAYDYYTTVSFFERQQTPGVSPVYAVHGSKSWTRMMSGEDLTVGQIQQLNLIADKEHEPQLLNRNEVALIDEISGREKEYYGALTIDGAVQRQISAQPCGSRGVPVIPLFSTVHYEASGESGTLASQASLGLSVGASPGLAAVGAGIGASASDQQASLSTMINTPFSVASLSDNTLQVRLAAVFAGTKRGYVAPADQYDLTVLVLLRRANLTGAAKVDPYLLDLMPCPEVSFAAFTTARDVSTGAELERADPHKTLLARLSGSKDAEALATAVEGGDVDAFARTFNGGKPGCQGRCIFAWASAVADLGVLGRSAGTFTVPDSYFHFFTDGASAGFVDDGKTGTLTIADPLANVTAVGLLATVGMVDPKTGAPHTLYPTSTVVDGTGRTAVVKFPSASSVCPGEKEKDPSPCTVCKVSVLWGRPSSRWYTPAGRPYYEWTCPWTMAPLNPSMDGIEKCLAVSKGAVPAIATASITVAAGRMVLIPPDRGSFHVIVRPASAPAVGSAPSAKVPVSLSVDGADVTMITDASVTPHLTHVPPLWIVTDDADLTVHVENVVPNSTIHLKATNLNDKQKPEPDPGASVSQDVAVVPAAPATRHSNQ